MIQQKDAPDRNSLILSSLLLLAILLSIPAAYATQSGTWTGTNNNGDGSTPAGSGDGEVTITVEVTNTTNSGEFETGTDNIGTVDAFSESTINADPALEGRFRWGSGTNGTGHTGTATVKFTFDRAVTNPVLHIDKLGGSAYQGGTYYWSNSALLTLDVSTGQSLTHLPGNVAINHFNVGNFNGTTNQIWRTPDIQMGLQADGVQWECSATGSDATGGTACGSVRINGTVTEVVFDIVRIGTVTGGNGGTNDLMEFMWTFDQDLGDAPQGGGYSYDGAVHSILEATNGTPLLYLGAVGPDDEDGSQPTTDADGDNTTGTNDEDGVTFRSPAGTGETIYADVDITNSTGGNVNVCAWLDVPTEGSATPSVGPFIAADGACDTAGTGTTSTTFSWSGLPTDKAYTTYARFRVTSDSMGTGNMAGAFSDGEVEDYQVKFDFNPTAVTMGNVELGSVPVPDFLGQIGLEQADVAALYALLMAWAPDLAASVDANDREAILAALTQFLDSDGDGQVAIIAWQTLEERGTIGFYVERQQDGGTWIMLNDEMLPGLITAPMGGEYKLADPEAVSGRLYQYRIIEQEARGTQRSYGPFELEIQ